jgi:hypothetical protein
MITEQELNQRLARIEQELSVLKQQLGVFLTPQPPTVALSLLEQLWQIESAEKPALELPQARERLTHDLPACWGSQLIRRQRAEQ